MCPVIKWVKFVTKLVFAEELEITRKAHLSLSHSLIFGITQLDSRRGK